MHLIIRYRTYLLACGCESIFTVASFSRRQTLRAVKLECLSTLGVEGV